MTWGGWGGSNPTAPTNPNPTPGTGADVTFRHVQNAPAKVWEITHNLGKRPSVVTVDSAGTVVEGDPKWLDDNRMTVTFAAPFSGEAYLN